MRRVSLLLVKRVGLLFQLFGLMAKSHFQIARARTRQFLLESGTGHHMHYGPLSDEYWSASLRVLAVNMEPYGYEECGHTDVDLNCLLDWMHDRGHTGTKTVRYTLAIVATLFDACAGLSPTSDTLRRAYADAARLETVARHAAYYNIRPTSNSDKAQDARSIVASGVGTTADLIRQEMVALEPHVIFVSGQPGLAAFNSMWQLEPRLRFLENCWHGDQLFQSIRHPSRPRYDEYASTIARIAQALKGKLPKPAREFSFGCEAINT